MVSNKAKMGRRADNADPLAVPPPLPPSVEEAYRRKCLQLKQRTMEVEEANDAARLRLTRLQRQVEKLRIERAFLLEQIAKRTSANVEDSEGSPSPPPTVRDGPSPSPIPSSLSIRPAGSRRQNPSSSSARVGIGSSGADLDLQQQPQEKPLRSKRGHRKPSVIANLDSNGPPPTFINQAINPPSPSSDAYSHTNPEASQKDPSQRANGVAKPPKKPNTAFDLYCRDQRPTLASKGEDVNVDEELARGWKELPEDQRDEYKSQETKAVSKYEKEKEQYAKDQAEAEEVAAEVEAEAEAEAEAETEADAEETAKKAKQPPESQGDGTPARDEDVEMQTDDTPAAED